MRGRTGTGRWGFLFVTFGVLAGVLCQDAPVVMAQDLDQLPEEIRKRIEESRSRGTSRTERGGEMGDPSDSADDRAQEERRQRAREEAERRRNERRVAAEKRATELQSQISRGQAPGGARPGTPATRPAGAASTTVVGIQRQRNEGRSTYSFEPTDLQRRVGDVFNVDLRLENPSAKPFDSISVAIVYDPSHIQVIDPTLDHVDDTLPVEGAIRLDRDPASGYLNYIDREQGLIRYAGSLPRQSVLSVGGYIWSVSFEALRPTVLGNQQTQLDFSFDLPSAGDLRHNPDFKPYVERGTYLVRRTQEATDDFLGDEGDPTDGGVMCAISIIEEDRGLNIQGEILVLSDELQVAAENDTLLRIYPVLPDGASVIRVGDEFDVEVSFDNPKQVEFNRVALFLAYNPRVLEPVDYDRVPGSEGGDSLGNWIQHGINVLDGPYHETYPFNMFVENEVRPDRGMIRYEMGNQQEQLMSEGPLLRSRFRAIAPTLMTRLKAFRNRDGDTPTTGVFLHSIDVLGSSLDHTDGIVIEPFAILPALELAEVDGGQ